MIYQQRFTPSPELGAEDNKINKTQPPLLGSRDADLPSTNGTILGHAKEQSKRVYVKQATLAPILEQRKGLTELHIQMYFEGAQFRRVVGKMVRKKNQSF